MLLLMIPMTRKKRRKESVFLKTRQVKVISRRNVKKTERKSRDEVSNPTKPGTVARNEMDTHADTCCAGANWVLMEYTGEICEVSPFLSDYDPVTEIPLARCGTVWTSPDTGEEFLLVGEQMLWFGDSLPHSLINPNQIREYGINVCDDPFSPNDRFGIDGEDYFLPFDTTGTIVYFETRAPTDWELRNLPVILITGEKWDPTSVDLRPGGKSREAMEMRTIRSLTSGMTRRQVSEARINARNSRIVNHGEVEHELEKISPVYTEKTFCQRLIGAVKIATTYRKDVDSVITNERHSKVSPEELARKWNIGLQTAKDTLAVTKQDGVRTAVHPMTRRVRVDHMRLHRPRLRDVWYCDTLISKVKSLLGNKYANVFTQGKFTKVVPEAERSQAGITLTEFTDDVGIPEVMITDGAGEFTAKNKDFQKEARQMRIKMYTTESGRKNQNHAAEREIGTLSKRWKLV